MLDEPVSDSGVAGGGLGVVAHDEPLGAGPIVAAAAGADPDLLDLQVARHGAVAARPGQRGGGLGVGVAQLLGVDVVPTTTLQIGAVSGGGGSAVGDPNHPPPGPCTGGGFGGAGGALVAFGSGGGP